MRLREKGGFWDFGILGSCNLWDADGAFFLCSWPGFDFFFFGGGIRLIRVMRIMNDERLDGTACDELSTVGGVVERTCRVGIGVEGFILWGPRDLYLYGDEDSNHGVQSLLN